MATNHGKKNGDDNDNRMHKPKSFRWPKDLYDEAGKLADLTGRGERGRADVLRQATRLGMPLLRKRLNKVGV